MIAVENLTKRYGSFVAVKGLSLDVRAGRGLALWGPNGAGKTTLIKCVLGLIPFDGSIRIDGFDVAKNGRRARAAVGYVPQELAFYDDMTVLETTHFFARLKKSDRGEIATSLETVGLLPHAHKPVHALSGGMKQRLALALALLGDPPVLVLDEPTSNLDAAGREHFLKLLLQLKLGGKTILLTSHRIDEVEALADEALALERGECRELCPARALASRLNLHMQMKLYLPGSALDNALHVLQADGYTARRNGTGILVQARHDAKALPIHSLQQAGIVATDFEME